jgi:poly(3-hydroxybutyrate) depolymerase
MTARVARFAGGLSTEPSMAANSSGSHAIRHHRSRTENTVPLFWPLELGAAVAKDEMDEFGRSLKTLAEAEELEFGLVPKFATANKVRIELHTMRLRDFSVSAAPGECPTLIDAPYAGHTAVIADFHEGQSLVETLLGNGLTRVLVTDWKSATEAMKDYDIDNYLAEINVCVDDLGGRVNLVGLCQGGWMSAMYAARYPGKVRSLVLAGSPIDTDAGNGAIKAMAHELPLSQYEDMVALGGGLMRGRFMLEAWKNMHPGEQYFSKYVDLYEHIDDPVYVKKQEDFEAWYENPIDLPGRWYLQAVQQLFQENRLAKGTFNGLGRLLSLKDVTCPVYLLAGSEDDITTKEQVFDAEKYLGTPPGGIVKALVPGGHIGLFMGARTLHEHWPKIAAWIKAAG